ncbi:hypothetical protein F2Q69_00037625 [Brassica cretica]|uniref:Transmembrane protein n=1 Tax=Brassica cretica TaxID=69181 RepID=A0A8S9STN4_BRACR|nr:hypothetical protein F2Q69_00037625 [Brassica cretica]
MRKGKKIPAKCPTSGFLTRGNSKRDSFLFINYAFVCFIMFFLRLLLHISSLFPSFPFMLASRIICSSAGYWFKAGLVDLVVFPSCLLVKSSIPSPLVLESCSSHNMCGVSRFLSLHLYLRWGYWFSSCGFSQVMSGFVKDGFSSLTLKVKVVFKVYGSGFYPTYSSGFYPAYVSHGLGLDDKRKTSLFPKVDTKHR